MPKLTNFIEKALLLNFSIFLVFTPFFREVVKPCLCIGATGWLLINILKYKLRFFRGFIPVNPLNKPILLFGVACILSIIFSLGPYHSQAVFFERYLPFIIFFWIGLGLVANSKKNLYVLISAFILVGFIFGLGGIRDYIYYRYTNPALSERLWSVFGYRISYYGFPLYLTYFIPFDFAVFLFARYKFLKIAGFVNLILLFLCLLCNGSRIGLIAALAGLLFIGFLRKKKTIFTSSIILITLLVLISFLSPTLRWRLETIPTPSEWSFRLPLYKSAISIFQDYPVFGAGIGMFEKVLYMPKYEPQDYPIPKELSLHTHNTYLEVAAEMGIIGFLLFIWIFVVFFIKSLRLIIMPKVNELENGQAIFIGLVGTILAILIFAFGTTIITVGLTVSSYFWFLFGIATGLWSNLIKETSTTFYSSASQN